MAKASLLMARVYPHHVYDEGLESIERNFSPTKGRTLQTCKELSSEDQPGVGDEPYEWRDLSPGSTVGTSWLGPWAPALTVRDDST